MTFVSNKIKPGQFNHEITLDAPMQLLEPAGMGVVRSILERHRIPYHQPSIYHIKVGNINYYPTRNTVYKDGAHTKYKSRGVDFFLQLLVSEGLMAQASYDAWQIECSTEFSSENSSNQNPQQENINPFNF